MIELIFYLGKDIILVRIEGNSVYFSNSEYGQVYSDISGLKLNKEGVIREFPDLKLDLEWREKAIKRFKEHIRSLPNEGSVSDYVIKELRGQGYIPKFRQLKGFRREKIN